MVQYTGCINRTRRAFNFGDEPRNDPQLKSPGVADWDAAVVSKKLFPSTATEGSISISGPSSFRISSIGSSSDTRVPTQGVSGFGVISSQANNPRIVQFAQRLSF